MKLEYLSPAKKEALEAFLDGVIFYPDKSILAKFSGIKTFDTAYPADYAKRIREIFPQFNGSFMVYNYDKERIFGEFSNVAEMSITKLSEILNAFEE